MRRKMPRLCILLPILAVLTTGTRLDDRYEPTSIYYTEPTTLVNTSIISNNGLYELHGGSVIRGERILPKSKSPYLLREDLFIEKDGKLIVEPGVEIRFGPMVGITIRGIISAKVMINNRISNKRPSKGKAFLEKVRIVLENKSNYLTRSLTLFSIM